jgi:rod shape-determining protein MreC
VIVAGDNSAAPPIYLLEKPDLVRPGDRIVTTGDGEVFPPGLLIGQVAQDPGGRLRARLAADYERLEFLRVLRDHGARRVDAPSELVLPQELPDAGEPEPTEQPDG